MAGSEIAAGMSAAATTTATAVALTVVGTAAVTVAVTAIFASYCYERHMWKTGGKEREFKQQFVAHMTKQLQSLVDLTSADCSRQVQQ